MKASAYTMARRAETIGGSVGEGACGDDQTLPRYVVKYGAFHGYSQWFATFHEALACYRAHQSDHPEGASIYGAGYDDESDGLTAEERDEVVG